MSTDLIFHILSKRKWQERNNAGTYSTGEDEIECVTASFLNEYLNSQFQGRKNLLLLVIDQNRLANSILKEENGKLYLSLGINLDAVLDKIRVDSAKDGSFDIQVESHV
ncbi:MAG: hypothetical protein EA391_03190 [Balneolaceae bacterium]|nr:MAG: hypothetical protein EA391_03190 [Balneolaceae bacterium]